jgi:hypothetical protein
MSREADLRSALVRVAELLDDGAVDEAGAFARSALRRPSRRRGFRCDRCGLTFRFPGQLDDHRRLTRCGDQEAA